MDFFRRQRVRGHKLSLCCLLGVILVATSGCISLYVSNDLPEVPAADMPRPANPQPTQLLFEFRTKGVVNGRATDLLRDQVREEVTESGLFSEITDQPPVNGSLLSLVVDNVPITDPSSAFAKGFGTGLTLGLVGSTVADGYICTVSYTPGGQSTPVTKEVRHAIYSTVGAKGAPPNATKGKSMDDAVRTMMRQLVTNGLKDLGSDPAFSQ